MTADDNSEIVRTIATLAHNLGMQVIAEGIETNEQYQQLKALGCEYGQGFLFSHPVDDANALKLLARDTERDEEMILGMDSSDADAALIYQM
jgi:EAL domain-containing protein (putative c-di-GMP-specific phosphodiesterase class I)